MGSGEVTRRDQQESKTASYASLSRAIRSRSPRNPRGPTSTVWPSGGSSPGQPRWLLGPRPAPPLDDPKSPQREAPGWPASDGRNDAMRRGARRESRAWISQSGPVYRARRGNALQFELTAEFALRNAVKTAPKTLTFGLPPTGTLGNHVARTPNGRSSGADTGRWECLCFLPDE